jgi:ATP-binding cassette subfamily G (WHITE) protein 2 (SNQ2)
MQKFTPRPSTRTILHDFNGVVRPGEMLRESVPCHPIPNVTTYAFSHLPVVLGSPGSGCTTFLKMLANQRDTYHDVQGDVHYDSLTPKDIAAHYRGDVQYSPEDDVHFPTLTVEETIGSRPRLVPHTHERMVKAGTSLSKKSPTSSPPFSVFAT